MLQRGYQGLHLSVQVMRVKCNTSSIRSAYKREQRHVSFRFYSAGRPHRRYSVLNERLITRSWPQTDIRDLFRKVRNSICTDFYLHLAQSWKPTRSSLVSNALVEKATCCCDSHCYNGCFNTGILNTLLKKKKLPSYYQYCS